MTRITRAETLIIEYEQIDQSEIVKQGVANVGLSMRFRPTGRVRKPSGTWFELSPEATDKIAEGIQPVEA
jgi:hypothetical protein